MRAARHGHFCEGIGSRFAFRVPDLAVGEEADSRCPEALWLFPRACDAEGGWANKACVARGGLPSEALAVSPLMTRPHAFVSRLIAPLLFRLTRLGLVWACCCRHVWHSRSSMQSLEHVQGDSTKGHRLGGASQDVSEGGEGHFPRRLDFEGSFAGFQCRSPAVTSSARTSFPNIGSFRSLLVHGTARLLLRLSGSCAATPA